MVHLTFYLIKVCLLVFKYVTTLGAFIININEKKQLPLIQDEIILKSANKLAEEIRKGKLKSVQVISAFIKRIEEVEPYINAVAQNCFKDALEEAKKADALIESGKFTEEQLEKEKQLLGVPFTVKILLKVKGCNTTAGSLILKDFISTEDAVVVALLKNAGGIILATTNSSELGSSMETNNYVHGRTNNPYDTSRIPGGSSGGEAALIASAGSVFGLASDVLGSIRIPSHFCGLFGHKPSPGIISNEGTIPPNAPVAKYFYVCGPICRYAEDLVLTMKLLSPENKEKFNVGNTVDFRKLKVFYLTELPNDPCVVNTDQEIVEAIHNAVSHFTKKYGCTAKKIKIPNLNNKLHYISFHLLYEGITDFFEHATLGRAKNVNPYLELIKKCFGMSQWTFGAILTYGFLDKIFAYKEENLPFYKSLNENLTETIEDLLDENTVLLFPTLPVAAPLHYASYFLLPSIVYVTVFNSTGMPATQCPMGLNKNGLPIGIQVAGRRNNDRLTIACAIELEKKFGGWIRPDKVNV